MHADATSVTHPSFPVRQDRRRQVHLELPTLPEFPQSQAPLVRSALHDLQLQASRLLHDAQAPPLLIRQIGVQIGRFFAAEVDGVSDLHRWLAQWIWAICATSDCPDIHARGAALLGEFAAGCALGMRNYEAALTQAPIPLEPPPSIATALDRTQALIMVLDGAGQVLMFNRACEQLTGIAAEAIVGNYLWDYGLIPHDAHAYIPDLTQGVLDRLPKRYVNVWPESALGTRRIEWDIQLVAGSDAQTRTIVCTGTDTTEPWLAQQALRDVRRRLTAHQDAAFVRLAQELHDGPLQELYQVQLTLLSQRQIGNKASPTVHQVINNVIGALRSWCVELRPPALQSLGLTAAIESHLHDLQRAHPELRLRKALQADCLVLDEDVRIHLYRIYQAACTNILRHANAQTISVRFAWDAEAVILDITDDGKGFTLPTNWADLAAQGHYGLLGMLERADSCNGTLTIITAPGLGTLVRAALPGVIIDEAEVAL